jgi:hypothetical protein
MSKLNDEQKFMINSQNVAKKCYDKLTSQGIKNPPKHMAEKSGVAEMTIRGWLNGKSDARLGLLISVTSACGFTIKLVEE